MESGRVFSKTIKFSLLKLAAGFIITAAVTIVLAVLMLIAALFDDEVKLVMFTVWFALAAFIVFLISRYVYFSLGAGHIAAITGILISGEIPDGITEVAREAIRERYEKPSEYFSLRRRILSSIRQLQDTINRSGGVYGKIPGAGGPYSPVNMLISMSLSNIANCCIGYTFYMDDLSISKSAAEGVVVYFCHWKKLLRNAAVMMIISIISVIIIAVLMFFPINALCSLFMSYAWIPSVMISLLFSIMFKIAFLDSWIFINTMKRYISSASATSITYDLYGRLCSLSKKYRDLYVRGQREEEYFSSTYDKLEIAKANPVQPQMNPQVNQKNIQYPQQPNTNQYQRTNQQQINQQQQNVQKSVFCTECGQKNGPNNNFCINCGAKLKR